MNNMRRGFTMIELIFVIVIIGILAAVAIPKLAATRDDAKISNIIANARTALGDMTAFYTSQGATVWTDTTNTKINTVTNVKFDSGCGILSTDPVGVDTGTNFLLCDESIAGANICLTFDVNATAVTVTATSTTGVICSAVATDPAIVGMLVEPTTFGGIGVVR